MNMKRLLTVVVLLAFGVGGCSGDSANNKLPPGTPLGLTAVPGDGEITLSWQADPDGIRTGVYVWQGESSSTLAERDFVAAPATEFVVTGLVNGTTYHFALEAEDEKERRSERSAVVAATPEAEVLPKPPPKAENFAATPGNGLVTVSWTFRTTRAGEPKGVHVYWGTNPEDLDQAEFVTYPDTEYVVSGLDNGQDYGFAAEVEDQDGLMSERTEVQVVRPHEYDTTGPTILSTVPADGSQAVDPEALLSITFSESMRPSSIEITPDPGRALRTMHWNQDNSEVVTGPQVAWQEGQTYWIKVTGNDRWGNPIEGRDVFSFTAGYESQVPEISGFSPDDGLTDVGTNSRLTVTFSEVMEHTSTNRALSIDPDVPLSYGVSEPAQTFIWTPQTNLLPDTSYTVTVASTAKNLEGVEIGTDISFQFSTGSGPDETPPSVVSYLPENGANGVEQHFEIAIAFSEPMDHAWTQAALTFLTHPALTGTYTWNDYGTILRFHPDEDPEPGELIRWKLLGQAKDLAGNDLGQEVVAEFQIIRVFEVTIPGNGALDGSVGLLSEPGQWGDHRINTTYNFFSIGNINYTYLGPAVQRGFYSFELDVLPEDLTRITFAEIIFVQSGMWGDCEEIGDFFLESVAYGPALTLDDFDTPVLDVEVCDEFDVCQVVPAVIPGQCPIWSSHVTWSGDVTPVVKNDWDDRLARMHLSQWRLRIEHEQEGATGQTMFFKTFNWSNWPNERPRLIVRYEIP